MTNNSNTRSIVADFIDTIWNQRHFDQLDKFIHPAFIDHGLPPQFPADKEGLKQWILATGISFEHSTHIEEQVTEADKSILKIRMHLRHIGTWREIPPTGAAVSTVGYRCFRVADNKIIEHWALIDGNALENQLKESSHGCKIQV
jgi:predicted ester cyclase